MARASSAVVSTKGRQRPEPALLIRISGVPASRLIRALVSAIPLDAPVMRTSLDPMGTPSAFARRAAKSLEHRYIPARSNLARDCGTKATGRGEPFGYGSKDTGKRARPRYLSASLSLLKEAFR